MTTIRLLYAPAGLFDLGLRDGQVLQATERRQYLDGQKKALSPRTLSSIPRWAVLTEEGRTVHLYDHEVEIVDVEDFVKLEEVS